MTNHSDRTRTALKISLCLYLSALISSISLWVFGKPGTFAVIVSISVCVLVVAACITMIYAINLREAELNSKEGTDDD